MSSYDRAAIALDPELAQRLAQLSPAKRLFIERQMRRALADDTSVIAPRGEAGPIPLSFSQEDMWHIEQSAPGLPTYNVPRAMRITGMLDVELLQTALNALVERHDVLRTTVESVAGEPRAIVQTPRPVPVKVVDLRSLAPADREDQLQRTLRAAAVEPFDLERDLLLRAAVVLLGHDDYALALVSHHFASDESSARILFGDFAAIYNSLRSGEPVELPLLPLTYADFATWQRAHWRGPRLDELVSLWERELAAAPERLELPVDRARPAFPSFAGERRDYRFPPALTQAIVELGAAHGATAFVTLLTAFQTLLHRYNGQDDIYVASVFTGRANGELTNVLGYFSSVLPLGAHFALNPTFVELLAQVREGYLFALDHSEVSFEKVAAEISARSSADRVGTFSAMFTAATGGPGAPSLDGLSLTPLAIDHGTAKLDLMFGVGVTAEGLSLSVEYRTQLFDASTIDRIVENFETLLAGIVGDPECRVSRLPLLGLTERRLLAGDDAAADSHGRPGATVVDLLREQSRRTPDAVAVECGDEFLTYAQLDARANQLGAFLHARGVGPDVIVGVCVDRSLDMLVAVLGIQRAGGAYVPLDPNLPRGRIAFMLDDSGAAFVVTQFALRERLPARVPLLFLDREHEAIGQSRHELPERPIDPADLAYIIYTSGTTGRPKGAQIEHRNLFNFVTAMQAVVRVAPGEALVAAYSISFDPWGEEFYVSLAYGARIVVAPYETTVDSKALAALYERVKPALGVAPPAIWRMLIEAGWQGTRGLRIRSGGEALPPQLADQLLDRAAEVWNVYGPTEATIVSTVARVERGREISIGAPLRNVTAHILDKHLQLVPVGVAGELYIGGRGVGRGYHNRPELTDERFVRDPFATQPEARLYRTGDLVRRRPDGLIDYLGRLDEQVKLRGLRIELGEIENALREHPAIADATVLMLPDGGGESMLVAWYVARADAPADLITALRTHLVELLPRYMVPTHFVEIDALPLTANGKVDRNVLATTDIAATRIGHAPVAPRTSTEERIAQIWSHVMQRDAVGVEESFFDLGGHSILAIRIVSRIRETFGVRVPLAAMFDMPTVAALARFIDASASPAEPSIDRAAPAATSAAPADDVVSGINNPLHHQLRTIWLELLGTAEIGIRDNFLDIGGTAQSAARMLASVEAETGKIVAPEKFLEHPTIAHLAAVILAQTDSRAGFPLLALTTTGSRPPLFFAHSDLNGAGFYTRKFAQRLGPNQPFYVLAPHGSDGQPSPPTIEDMALEYITAIRAVRPDGPYILGGFCSGGLVALEMARRLRKEGVEVLNVVLLDAPSGNVNLAHVASAIDKAAAVLRFDDKRRLAACAVLGNAAAWGRRRSNSLRRAVRLLRAGGIRAVSARLVAGPRVHDWVEAELPWLEPFWRRVTLRHIPRPYAGRVTLLVSEQHRSVGEAAIVRRWRTVSEQVSLHPVPGEHLTCITQFAEMTAAEFAMVLTGETPANLEDVA